jgi:hypothetical protein
MAKRAAPNEQPYRPLLDANLVSETLGHGTPSASTQITNNPDPQPSRAKIVEMPPEMPRRAEETRQHPDISVREVERERRQPLQLFEKIEQEKRVLLTLGETQAIDRLVTSLASRLQSQVKFSHVARALFGLLLHAEREIDRRAGENGALTRPPNGDAQALQKFEKAIGKIIASAIRDAGPLG